MTNFAALQRMPQRQFRAREDSHPCALQGGPVRLGQLVRLIPTASKKLLAENLRQLERDGVIVRTDLSDILLRVEYDYAVGFRLEMTSVLARLANVGDLRRKKAD